MPIWVSEPIGLAWPRRIASTPAMNVVATAPMPGSSTPSFPLAGRMSAFFVIGLIGADTKQAPGHPSSLRIDQMNMVKIHQLTSEGDSLSTSP